MTMATSRAVIPGDGVGEDLTASSGSSKTLTLGPGLKFTLPADIRTVVAGTLAADPRKNAVWVDNNGHGRYIPAVGDLVIAQVHHSSMDFYHCSISPYCALATLPQLAFEGASKKTRPLLQAGSLVYARLSQVDKHMEPVLECVQSSGKAEGLGELKGGMLYEISVGMARRMMAPRASRQVPVTILDQFGENGLKFEVAVGRNGRIWVNSDSVKTTILLGSALQTTDVENLSVADQAKLVKKLLKQT